MKESPRRWKDFHSSDRISPSTGIRSSHSPPPRPPPASRRSPPETAPRTSSAAPRTTPRPSAHKRVHDSAIPACAHSRAPHRRKSCGGSGGFWTRCDYASGTPSTAPHLPPRRRSLAAASSGASAPPGPAPNRGSAPQRRGCTETRSTARGA
ncbi:hypothetical protein B0H12DRAFT_277420 [Mycena haematopus]|nr:hypothetical protein B0H12DRAFT_277420 [Mycena haematopus]